MSSGTLHELLEDSPGKTLCVLGNHAIVRGALEAGVQFFSCYPGTPSSEVGDTIARIAEKSGIIFQYSINEKVAVEVAHAASLTHARSMCAMKHLGLTYAGDPVSTLPYVGVEGGLVIVSAGDPSVITSPNEQDQRHFTAFLYYPIFDPATPADALRMTRHAFELSEKTRLPVILRPTTRVCHTSGMIELGSLPKNKNEIFFEKDPSRYVPIPINARRMRKELTERYALAERLLAESAFFPRKGDGKHGIIAGGVGYAYVSQVIRDLGIEDRISLLQIGAYPIPEKILAAFLSSVESVLVVEELTPFIEDWVTKSAYRMKRLIQIRGKVTGHLPLEFEYTPDLVEAAVRDYMGLEKRPEVKVSVPELPPRPPVLCPGCPHRTSFYHMKKVFGKKTVYVNDIGCYTLGYGRPLQSCDVLLCMGSSISPASGIARTTGKRTVAYIGDSTFYHSGMTPLANAVFRNDAVTVVILNNYIAAMTGFQPSFAAREDGLEMPSLYRQFPTGFSLEKTVRGLGVEEVFVLNDFEEKPVKEALKKARDGQGVNVVIMNSPCRMLENRVGKHVKRPPYAIDLAKCDGCALCVLVLGCPAIYLKEEAYYIDEYLCDGCALCAQVCNKEAVYRVPIHQGPIHQVHENANHRVHENNRRESR